MPHPVFVIVTEGMGAPVVDGHCGYVAGRYRDGAFSDTWTDVSRCARGTFVGYAPACTCGWSGEVLPGTPSGMETCRLEVIANHLSRVATVRPVVLATVSSLRPRVRSRPQVASASPRFQSASA